MLKQFSLLVAMVISGSAYSQSPSLFMEGRVSTSLNERDMAIAPDGSEMYYTSQTNRNILSTILLCKKSGNSWSQPEVAPFSGLFNDLEPTFSPDGNKLFFCSNRPLTGNQTKDYDIWVMERNANGWSEPKNLGAPVNTAANEFYPSIAQNGNLYFTAEKEDGVGREDIFVSRLSNGTYSVPAPLDTAVNSKLWEFNAFVAPDESYIIFTSYGRKDDAGGGDLYISLKRNNQWLPAENLKAINSEAIDYCPFVHQNVLYFTSGRHNITSTRQNRMNYQALTKWYGQAINGSENIYTVDLKQLVKQ